MSCICNISICRLTSSTCANNSCWLKALQMLQGKTEKAITADIIAAPTTLAILVFILFSGEFFEAFHNFHRQGENDGFGRIGIDLFNGLQSAH